MRVIAPEPVCIGTWTNMLRMGQHRQGRQAASASRWCVISQAALSDSGAMERRTSAPAMVVISSILLWT